MVVRTCALVVLLAGCDRLFLEQRPDALADAPPDSPPPTIEAFGEPVKLSPFDGTGEDDDPSLTGDELELYMLRSDPNADIFRSVRANRDDPWPEPTPVAELNTTIQELRPAVAADGLTLYFGRGPANDRDILVSTRTGREEVWSNPVELALDLNQPGTDELPGWSSADGLRLLFESSAGGKRDLYLATRPSTDAAFTSVPLVDLNREGFDEVAPWANRDGTRVVFVSNRTGSAAFYEAVEHEGRWYVHYHENLDTADPEGTPWLSPDGSTLVFSRTQNGNDDLWIARRAPIAAN